jgi:site-specific recombinase XerD
LDNFLALHTASFIPQVRSNKRCCLAGFLRYIYFERRILTKNLASLLQGPRIFSCAKPPKFLRAHELVKLFERLEPKTSWEIRAYAMLHCARYLGLRSKEISVLTLDDISFSQAEVRLTERKNAVPIILPLPEYTIKAIAAYIVGARHKTTNRTLFIGLRAPYEPVCSSVISRNIGTYIRMVNPSASAYWLRHTYAQNLLEQGASIFDIKEMLGHERIQSTEKYLHIHTGLMREVLLDETL